MSMAKSFKPAGFNYFFQLTQNCRRNAGRTSVHGDFIAVAAPDQQTPRRRQMQSPLLEIARQPGNAVFDHPSIQLRWRRRASSCRIDRGWYGCADKKLNKATVAISLMLHSSRAPLWRNGTTTS